MNKILKLEVFEHPNLDYSEWSKLGNLFHKMGVHVLKDGSSYTRLSPSINYFVASAVDTPHMLSLCVEPDNEKILPPAPTIGISENALLAALAITRDPTLSLQLLAMRHSHAV